jgi:hypothetical protein
MGKVIQFRRGPIMSQVDMPSPFARGFLFALIPSLMLWAAIIMVYRAL